jgi:hypothetical protein
VQKLSAFEVAEKYLDAYDSDADCDSSLKALKIELGITGTEPCVLADVLTWFAANHTAQL